MNVHFDGSLDIATSVTCKRNWKNQKVQWSALLKKLAKPTVTYETVAQYAKMDVEQQSKIKNVGGFVGGYLVGGRRLINSVQFRQILTLDIDAVDGNADFWFNVTMNFGFACCMHSTHKHTPEKQRLRLIIPLNRPVNREEYEAIGRRIAVALDIEQFDNTTFQPERLMYWPSHSSDGVWLFEEQDGPWCDADAVLAEYVDWKDISEWPVSEKHNVGTKRDIKKQEDPTTKKGPVGIWCRTFDIHEAMEMLGDVYERSDTDDDRYTFTGGSTANGVVIYDDKWAYSHHMSDPISGRLVNSFDMVRIHKFGDKDVKVDPDTKATDYPSYKAMLEFCLQNKDYTHTAVVERVQSVTDDFGPTEEVIEDLDEAAHWLDGDDAADINGGLEENFDIAGFIGKGGDWLGTVMEFDDDTEWLKGLQIDKNGVIKSTYANIILVMRNDKVLKGVFALDLMKKMIVLTRSVPWRKVQARYPGIVDRDLSHVAYRLEKIYGIGDAKLAKAFEVIVEENKFHPVQTYLKSVEWDKKERLDRLFIDYFGATDNDYHKAAARKWAVGAVARIFEPGVKFDYMPILIGIQGIKKSTFADKLGKSWFSDSFTTVKGREAYEQLQGMWIIEVAELSAMKNAEVETVKHFISKRNDFYRASYDKYPQEQPRQCVFIGSSNSTKPLLDNTGNRRFWPVQCNPKVRTKDPVKDLIDSEVDQIWAEALIRYKSGEKLYMSDQLETVAKDVQRNHTKTDERVGLIETYLEQLVPSEWHSMQPYERRAFYKAAEIDKGECVVQRDAVCAAEIYYELFDGKLTDMTKQNLKFIHDAMEAIPGWKWAPNQKRFGTYGKQRFYERVQEND